MGADFTKGCRSRGLSSSASALPQPIRYSLADNKRPDNLSAYSRSPSSPWPVNCPNDFWLRRTTATSRAAGGNEGSFGRAAAVPSGPHRPSQSPKLSIRSSTRSTCAISWIRSASPGGICPSRTVDAIGLRALGRRAAAGPGSDSRSARRAAVSCPELVAGGNAPLR
jgi:hypothetical protein